MKFASRTLIGATSSTVASCAQAAGPSAAVLPTPHRRDALELVANRHRCSPPHPLVIRPRRWRQLPRCRRSCSAVTRTSLASGSTTIELIPFGRASSSMIAARQAGADGGPRSSHECLDEPPVRYPHRTCGGLSRCSPRSRVVGGGPRTLAHLGEWVPVGCDKRRLNDSEPGHRFQASRDGPSRSAGQIRPRVRSEWNPAVLAIGLLLRTRGTEISARHTAPFSV